jgi:hypothetical protein
LITNLAAEFSRQIDLLRSELAQVPVELADVPWRAGGWTRKQIVGHLLDSATNNRQRFVRAVTHGHYDGPRYPQEAWVAAHGYAEQRWETLVRWWQAEHEILVAIVERITQDRLSTKCVMAEEAPVTLQFLVEDYIVHQRLHFEQILRGAGTASHVD